MKEDLGIGSLKHSDQELVRRLRRIAERWPDTPGSTDDTCLQAAARLEELTR